MFLSLFLLLVSEAIGGVSGATLEPLQENADRLRVQSALTAQLSASASTSTTNVASNLLQSGIIMIAAGSIGLLGGAGVISYFVWKSGFAKPIAQASGAGTLIDGLPADAIPSNDDNGKGSGGGDKSASTESDGSKKSRWYWPFKSKAT